MSVDVKWQPMPAEYRRSAERYVTKYLHIVPSWCHRLTIAYKAEPGDDVEDAVAAVSAEFEYRQAAIEIFPTFLEESEADREIAIAHELMHIAIQPLVDVARAITEKSVPDEALRLYFGDEITARMEGAVTDLARAVVARPKRNA